MEKSPIVSLKSMKALRKHTVKHGIVRHITRSLLEAKVPSVRKRLHLSMLLVVEARTKEREEF